MCAPPLCLQESTEQKPGDSQEQLAKLSSARVASKLRQSCGPQIKPVSHPSRRDHGGACRTAELSTWCAHNVPHSATGTGPSTLIYMLTKCSQPPWERGHGTE